MKTLTTRLSFNRLLSSLFTLSILFITGSAAALNTNGDPVSKNILNTTGVEYASIAATITNKSVIINWVTVSEQNNSHFEVERSTDQKSFKTVAMILDGFAANGTGKTYKFKEDVGNVKNGKTIYYRLKQIDTNNEIHYSTVMAIQKNTNITVFPKLEAVKVKNTSNNDYICVVADQKLLSKQSDIQKGI